MNSISQAVVQVSMRKCICKYICISYLQAADEDENMDTHSVSDQAV